jgi:hypothetical protein
LGKRTTYKRELDQEFQKTDRATARNPTAASRGSIMGTAMSLAPMLRPLRAVTRAGKVAQGVAAFGAPMAKIGGDMATGRFNEDVPCAEPTTTDPKKPSSRFWASNSLTNIYKKDTPGQSAPLGEDSVPVIRRSYMRTNPRTGDRKVVKGRSYKRERDFADDDNDKQDMPKGPVSV